MIDIKGQQVDIGDKVLVSTKRHGLILTVFEKESKHNYLFKDYRVERITKLIKQQYVGYTWIHPDGTEWDHNKHGRVDTRIAKYVGKGTNGTRYICTDTSNNKQSRVLKVDPDFEL